MGLQDVLKNLDVKKMGLMEMNETELKETQSMLISMVEDIDRVCKKNGIEWCLFGGSIIGAVRHDGFIPWDDDIDIFMTRENYNKFVKAAEELSDNYVLKEPGRENYLYHFPQLQLKRTELEQIQSTDKCNDGLFLDIFIMENAPDNKIIRYFHGVYCTFLLFVDSCIRMNLCKEHIFKYTGTSGAAAKEVNKRAKFAKFFAYRKFEKWLSRSDRVFSMCKNNNSQYIVCPSGRLHYFGETYIREEMCNYVKHTFDGRQWNIPAGYEYYLNKRYGSDYMTIPPKDKQEKHVYVKLNLHGNSKGEVS